MKELIIELFAAIILIALYLGWRCNSYKGSHYDIDNEYDNND